MRKLSKLAAVILTITLAFCMTTVNPIFVNAVNTTIEQVGSCGGVQEKLNSIASVYPTGSYFTASGNVCYSNQSSDCQLSNIPSRGGLPSGATAANVTRDAWSCCAFARYVFYCTFGLAPESCGTVSSSNAQIGDYMNLGSHYAIYLGQDSTYWYVYDSNYTSPATNVVKYNRALRKSNFSSVQIHHASNYDTINNSCNNPPVISEQKILAYDSGGYMLQCYVTDDTGVSSVKAATWTSKNGQDDLIWETMVNTEANTWKLYISYSNHNNEIGSYVNHIYAYDIQGNETSSEVVFCNDFEPPKITEAKIKAQDKNGYLISCKAEDNLGISNVKAAVWTLNNGQDDLIWDNMVNNGNGIWELYIPYKSHNCEEGFYRTHIYAYDDNNNSCSIAVDDLLVSIDINDYIPSNTVYYDNTKYEYFNYNTTWKQAEKICNLYGGHLVTITSQKEQDFINQLISNYSNQFCWVGATDENSEGKWKWITGEEFSYTNWATNEPNNANGEENYMHLNNSGRWNDIHYTGNEYTFGFICEYDKIDPNDYIPYQSIEFDGKKYEFFDYSLTWEQAYNVCEQKGGHLVTIGSDKENDIIWNTINNSSIEKFWIGATDKITESNWEWITGEPIEYTNWNSEEPNNSKGFENYAEIISYSGKWNDVYNYANINSLKYGFICEYEQTTILGDVSSDGVISIADATTLQKYLANIVNFDDEQLAVADTNGDGSVSIADATQIQKYLAQLIPSLG